MRRGGIAALLLCCTLMAQAVPMDFSAAWEAVQRHDDQLAAGEAAQQRAVALLRASRSLLLPQVDLVGSYTRLDTPIELNALGLNPLNQSIGTPEGQQFISQFGGPSAFITPITEREITQSSLLAFWPIYTGGKIKTARDLAALGKTEAEALLEEIRRARFKELVSTYFGVVLAEQAVATHTAAERTLAQHLQAAVSMERQGQISRVERLTAASAHDQARIDTRAAKDRLATARLALTHLVHAEDEVQPSSQLFVNAAIAPLQHFQPALQDHPGLRVIDARRQQAQALSRAARGAYHPEVFLYGSYSLYDDDTLASAMGPDWLLGIGVRLPLLDRSGRSGKVRAAESAVTEALRMQQGVEQQLQVLLETRHREAMQALAEYRDLASSIQLAQEALHLQEVAFREGLARALDVIDAQTQLEAAQTRRQAAAFRYVQSIAELLSLSGQYPEFTTYLLKGETIL